MDLSNVGDYLREKVFQTSDIEDSGADLTDLSQFGVECSNIVQSQEWIPGPDGDIGAWLRFFA